MRNLPDEELFSRLKERLQNFEEPPDDDVWEAIGPVISKPEPPWIRSIERSALLLSVLLMFGTWYTLDTQTEKQQILARESNAKSPIAADPLRDVGKRALSQTSSSALPGTLSTDKSVSAGGNLQRRDRPARLQGNRAPIQLLEEGPKGMARYEALKTVNALTTEAISSEQTMTQGQLTSLVTIDSVNSAVRVSSSVTTVDSSAHEPPGLTKQSRKKQGRWRAYGLATPSLTFLQVNPSTADDVTFDRLNSPGVLSKDRISLSFEAGAQFSITRRLAAFTALTFYQQSMDVSLEQFAATPGSMVPNRSLDFSFEPHTTTTTVNYRLQNIGLTAGILYAVSVGKIEHQLGTSIQYEYGMLQPSAESGKDATNNFLSYRILYRAAYDLNHRLSLFVQPSFTGSLLYDTVMDGALRVKQTRAGIGIGLLYRFP